jgi:hypothetical protein
MVLFAIVGELGSGKTLGLTYLIWTNWFKKHRRIFSNYNIFGIPYTKVTTIPALESMQSGFFAGDELWTWIDSWAGKSEKQKVISSILLKSRKRDITICYTTQTIQQINKRIRDVTDFVAYPIMSPDGTYARLEIFRGPKPSFGSYINPPRYFNAEPVYAMFNTYEEIKPIDEDTTRQEEMFNDIEMNPAWLKFLHEKKLMDDAHALRYSRAIQKLINPDNVKTEAERADKVEEYSTL